MQNDLFGDSTSNKPQTFIAFCDGAAKGNGKENAPGGWGFVLQDGAGNLIAEDWGGERGTTNNKMELTAAIETLKRVPEGSVIQIHTDSQYVIKGLTEWMRGWKAKGWVTASKEPVKNKDLWVQLDALNHKRKATWHWVRGHNGHPGNERADVLANKGAAQAISAA